MTDIKSLAATIVEKVTDIDKDGNYTVEQSQLDGTYTYDDEKRDMPKRTPITLTYKPSGQVTTMDRKGNSSTPEGTSRLHRLQVTTNCFRVCIMKPTTSQA